MGSLKLPNQYLLILEESNPEERLNKVDNDNWPNHLVRVSNLLGQ